jgi:hypothetical protein
MTAIVKDNAPAVGLVADVAARTAASFRTNLPGLVAVLVIGGVVVGGYAWVPAIHAALEAWSALTGRLGLWYAPLSFLIIGGLLPTLIMAWRRGRAPIRREWTVMALFWPERGLEVWALYTGLGHLFGTDTNWATVAAKTAFDMCLYSPLWALPVYLLVVAWSVGDRPLMLLRSSAFWRERYLPGLMANWLLWIPGVLMIYSLPAGLQLPVQNLFMVVWVLIASLIGAGVRR